MKKNSKKNGNNKRVMVKCSTFWSDEFDIDADIFDDIYMEAATRAVEKRKTKPGFKVTIIIECWEKKYTKQIDKHYCYNTYFILINAGMHHKAEMLRENFINMHDIDLKHETLKTSGEEEGKNKGGENNDRNNTNTDKSINNLPNTGSNNIN